MGYGKGARQDEMPGALNCLDAALTQSVFIYFMLHASDYHYSG